MNPHVPERTWSPSNGVPNFCASPGNKFPINEVHSCRFQQKSQQFINFAARKYWKRFPKALTELSFLWKM